MSSPSASRGSIAGPLTVVLALGAFLVASIAFVAVATDDDGGGGSSGGDGSAAVDVALSEFAITPSEVVTGAGPVSVNLTNSGTTAHNLSVVELDKTSADLQPGASGTLDLGDVSAGTYSLICTIPGHAEAGMKGTLLVQDDPSAGGGDTAGGDTSHNTVQNEFDNTQVEGDMTAGVEKFLEIADQYAAGNVKAGNERLEPTVLADGTKKFVLTAAITDWEVSPGNVVQAWTYNGMVPGPWIRVEPGDKVQVELKNDLPISTDVHFHGVDVPFDQDGVAPITQDYIRPGTTYLYEFTAPSTPKLGMYHAHLHGHISIINGLFAIFQVGDVPLPTGRSIAGMDVPADLNIADLQEIPMVLNDAGVIGLTLNGKSFPATAPIAAKKGEWLVMHFFNEGLTGHPMHLHRQPHLVIAKDGYPLAEPYRVDTLWVAPGERYTVLINAEDPGIWAFHCHIVSHAENDQGLFGMVTAMVVDEEEAA